MKKILFLLVLLIGFFANGQTPVVDGVQYAKHYSTAEMNAIPSPANGRYIYNSDTNSLWSFDGSVWAEASDNGIAHDAVPTDGSTNGVESNGVFDALALKFPYTGGIITGNIHMSTNYIAGLLLTNWDSQSSDPIGVRNMWYNGTTDRFTVRDENNIVQQLAYVSEGVSTEQAERNANLGKYHFTSTASSETLTSALVEPATPNLGKKMWRTYTANDTITVPGDLTVGWSSVIEAGSVVDSILIKADTGVDIYGQGNSFVQSGTGATGFWLKKGQKAELTYKATNSVRVDLIPMKKELTNDINWEAASTKTLGLDDAGLIFYNTGSSTYTYTIPTDATADYGGDVAFTFKNEDATGKIKILGQSGVTVENYELDTIGAFTLVRRGIDNWTCFGDCKVHVNPNPEQYAGYNNALALVDNADATTGLDAIASTTQSSKVNTSPAPVGYMWEVVSTSVGELTRGREVFTVAEASVDYEVEFWAKQSAGTNVGGCRIGFQSVSVDPNIQLSNTWTKYKTTINPTSINPVISLYTNRDSEASPVGSIGDAIQITGLTIKKKE